MISALIYWIVPAVFLGVMLYFLLAHRRRSQAVGPVFSYEHRVNLDPYLKTTMLDREFLPLLFRQEDFLFLRQFPFAQSELHRLQQSRRAALMEFLIQLSKDVDELVFVHRYLARNAERLSVEHEWIVLRERMKFALRYAWVRATVRLHWWLTDPTRGILGLAKLLENWKAAAEARLGVLSPAQLKELQSDLRLRSMQAEII